jgi:hypothetical protein
LQGLKTELTKLEREIAQNIKAKQELHQQKEQPELKPAESERENQQKPADTKVIDILPAGTKTPAKDSISQTMAYGAALNEHVDQVFKKTKGVRL